MGRRREYVVGVNCEVARDDADPFTSTGQEYQRYRLWTQNEWYLFREEVKKGAGGAGRRQAKLF